MENILTRDGRYRVEFTVTERDLAMHANADYCAPTLFEVESGRLILSLSAADWNAITTVPWGESGVQFRLAQIESGIEFFLVVDPGRGRFCLDKGRSLQMWNDELPEAGVVWQSGLKKLNATLEEVYRRAAVKAAQVAALPRLTIEHEETELSMAHTIYSAKVINSTTGESVLSLPDGRWEQSESRLDDGSVVVDFTPVSDSGSRLLRYNPATGRVCRLESPEGKAGPWRPVREVEDVWSGKAKSKAKRRGCLLGLLLIIVIAGLAWLVGNLTGL